MISQFRSEIASLFANQCLLHGSHARNIQHLTSDKKSVHRLSLKCMSRFYKCTSVETMNCWNVEVQLQWHKIDNKLTIAKSIGFPWLESHTFSSFWGNNSGSNKEKLGWWEKYIGKLSDRCPFRIDANPCLFHFIFFNVVCDMFFLFACSQPVVHHLNVVLFDY